VKEAAFSNIKDNRFSLTAFTRLSAALLFTFLVLRMRVLI
jgi:hypothetical protein